MIEAHRITHPGHWLLLAMLLVTTAVYWPGLSGGWLFDDYPNIVDNKGVQPDRASIGELTGAALSSPSSSFKRPLSSLSFAANYLAGGLDPWGWKLVNLIIHLLNGVLVFVLAGGLLGVIRQSRPRAAPVGARHARDGHKGDAAPKASRPWAAPTAERQVGVAHGHDEYTSALPSATSRPWAAPTDADSVEATHGRESANAARAATTHDRDLRDQARPIGIVAALIAGAWLLLPINLTGVLYVVQRMESLANLFVLLGLVGYVTGRRRMLAGQRGLGLCILSLVLATAIGVTAKETAVMLPLYAFLVEWIVFGFKSRESGIGNRESARTRRPRDRRVVVLFMVVLLLPMLAGLAWVVPHVLEPGAWATRDFTLGTRLLSEARIVVGYIPWTLVPLPHWLSFYHDSFQVSTGLLSPWTTLVSIMVLAALVAAVFGLRRRWPLVALGIALFLGCHVLTGTILPLELVYEHRNYFASFGLLLALVPLLAAPGREDDGEELRDEGVEHAANPESRIPDPGSLPFPLARGVLLAALGAWWIALTLATSIAWGSPLSLAQELAARAPDSPRAQYELGRTYIIASHYDPASPFTPKVYAPLERAAKLPDSSILPEQALIFFNARMHRPLKEAWWDSLIAKLKAHPPGVQDESSLIALTKCARSGACKLPADRMLDAFLAALSHPRPNARLLANYGDFAWNILNDHKLGLRATRDAVEAKPNEPAYHITLARMYLAQDDQAGARRQIRQLQRLNYGGRLDGSIAALEKQVQAAR